MSNEGSDKNVGRIENDIENIKKYIDLVLNRGYCDCNELNVISTGRYCDGSKNVAYSMQNILAEREQDKKRIKELEEERNHWHGCFIVAMENSIAKEKVINVIQEYKDKIERYNEYRIQDQETDVEYYENIANTIIVQVLQELLGGERNELER